MHLHEKQQWKKNRSRVSTRSDNTTTTVYGNFIWICSADPGPHSVRSGKHASSPRFWWDRWGEWLWLDALRLVHGGLEPLQNHRNGFRRWDTIVGIRFNFRSCCDPERQSGSFQCLSDENETDPSKERFDAIYVFGLPRGFNQYILSANLPSWHPRRSYRRRRKWPWPSRANSRRTLRAKCTELLRPCSIRPVALLRQPNELGSPESRAVRWFAWPCVGNALGLFRPHRGSGTSTSASYSRPTRHGCPTVNVNQNHSNLWK